MTGKNGFGSLLRSWRKRRRLTQMELAFRAEVSTRHLGFVETGRASPGRALVLRLAGELDMPLRERNALLLAAGFAPVFGDTSLADPAMANVRATIERVLETHKPFPAFALDRHWNVAASNGALPELYEGVAPELLQAPINVLRLSLHPEGIAPRIVNLHQWADHLMARLRREIELTGDEQLEELWQEAQSYMAGIAPRATQGDGHSGFALPLQVRTRAGILSFLSTVTVFGSPVDVVLSELALELFHPADAATRQIVPALARHWKSGTPLPN